MADLSASPHQPEVRVDSGPGPSDQLSVTFGNYGETVVLTVAGEVDLYTAPLLMSMLRRAFSANARLVVLDFADLTFIDSSGLAVLVTARQQAANSDCALRLAGGGSTLGVPLETAGLRDCFELYPSAGDAARWPLS